MTDQTINDKEGGLAALLCQSCLHKAVGGSPFHGCLPLPQIVYVSGDSSPALLKQKTKRQLLNRLKALCTYVTFAMEVLNMVANPKGKGGGLPVSLLAQQINQTFPGCLVDLFPTLMGTG